MWRSRKSRGFTLMEILIVVSILLIIFFLILMNFKTQISRAHDAKRKADLFKIQKVFEEMFNDTQCYPDSTIISTCNGSELQPYLKFVPCDPVRQEPYLYVVGSPSQCSGYRLCTTLEDEHDPDISRIGCTNDAGCGFVTGYNYCVSEGYTPSTTGDGDGWSSENLLVSPGATVGPTPSPMPGHYACSPAGVCNSYADIPGSGCPVSYADPNCMFNGVFQCTSASNRCSR